MPSSRYLISSQTLGSAAASVTFSSIPATYTDLVIKASVRTDRGGAFDNMMITFNGNSSAIYSETRLQGDGATATGSSGSSNNNLFSTAINGDTATASSFGIYELYIPSYTASQNKPMSDTGAQETNSTTPVYSGVRAFLFGSTTAISSITFTPLNGPNFKSTSSFYLYGIKNSA
jgi:hypothetical protein